MLQRIKKLTFTDGILLLALLLVGAFHESVSCLLSVVMGAHLMLRREKTFLLPKSPMALAIAAICLGYGLSCFWAVDRGMAFIGFLKFLPLILYLVCLQQDRPGCALEILPYAGAAMAVVSAVGMQIPVLRSAFSVAGRLAGFFQYPNTFAVFLLVCELLLMKKQEKKLWDYLTLALLVAGLLYTGSRTAFVVAVLSNAVMLLTGTGKKARMAILILGGAVCTTVAILAFSENSVLNRYLQISLTESTFVGRILYVVDALPLILKHPFGMGFMGYSYVQGSIQTGMYSVAYIHNDFVQLLLDTGWIPAALLMWAAGVWLFNKRVPVADKIIVCAVGLHCLFDFDLQFVGMGLLLLTLTREDGKPTAHKRTVPLRLATGAATAVCVYMGLALCLAQFGATGAANAMYPGNTANKLTMLEQAEDPAAAAALADEILKQNDACYVPYSIKAKYAYSQGDFGTLITNKKAVFQRNPFAYEEYEEYCQMLLTGIALYEQAGDSRSAQVCRQELITTRKALEANADRLSPLGKMITDQPVTQLPEEMQRAIDQLEKP